MKAKLKIQIVLVTVLCLGLTTTTAYAQGVNSVLPAWLTWDAVAIYAAVGAFFGWLHDFNDKQGQIIVPHKMPNGTWDLGIITPALLGAISGLVALSVQNTPALIAFFPSLAASAYPGILAAVFAGYFYTKTIQTIASMVYSSPPPATSATTPPKLPA